MRRALILALAALALASGAAADPGPDPPPGQHRPSAVVAGAYLCLPIFEPVRCSFIPERRLRRFVGRWR